MKSKQRVKLIDIYPLEDQISMDQYGEHASHPAFHDHYVYKSYTSEEYILAVVSGESNGCDFAVQLTPLGSNICS
jgi:hypothetical protein